MNKDNFSLQQFQERGLTGLTNLGNTCFMNTAISCLSHTTPLTWYFLRDINKNAALDPKTYQPIQDNGQAPQYIKDIRDKNKDLDETRVLHEWYRLLRGLWKKNGIVEPKSFHYTIQNLSIKKGNPHFGGMGQNDIHEFLVFLIDNLHTALEREVNITISGEPKTQLDQLALQAAKAWKSYFHQTYSIFVDLFYGQYISYVEAIEDHPPEQSFNYDPFCVVSIEIPKKENVTLLDCFSHFCQEEILEGDTQWYSDRDKCHKNAKKKIYFWSTPKILIVHLKRFNYPHKNSQLVDIPHELDMEPYCLGYDKYSSKYKLYAIANHTGNPMFGHYYAYCQNHNGQWYYFNDEDVGKINKENLITPNAYCLFYQKIKV